MLKKVIVASGLLLSICGFGYSQKEQNYDFQKDEAKLVELYDTIFSGDYAHKLAAEKDFHDFFMDVLKKEGAFYFPFDSLKHVGRIVSDDAKLVIFTWNIPHKIGHNYYGIIQYYNKKEKKVYVYNLDYEPGKLKKFPQAQAGITGWYGALYYHIVAKKYKGQVYYTLLGFNFNDILSNYKVVDVLAFDRTTYPYFPKRMFLYKGKAQNRMIFEYGERVNMTLEYNAKMDMIVFDHLSPQRPSMEGQYQFYGPDFSYDGFHFEDGVWKLEADIEIKL